MISEKEKQATLLSPTKKDYYQIWNELLDLASKISDRWTPSETNESDPGIILLKVLTACADKLNYNIDKNILEAYMPSAAQEESMRKLCEMMGYNMKYYRSATTDVTIYFNKNIDTEFQQDTSGIKELILPKFSQISNIDGDVNYLTLSQISFNKYTTSQTVNCIEGTLHYCAEENNRIVTINNIDDNYRYYLPVGQVAENGIFVYNIIDEKQNAQWEQVDNLNTIPLGKMCYKFGYDSKEMLPYLQFPEDIANIIGDGLIIAYIMTNGINGNINSKALSTFVAPEEWGNTEDSEYNRTGIVHAVEDFTCYNISAATNGSDKESLNEAYKNFKQTVGTFDTLITCRDYMNKIYDLTKSDYDTTPLVSNIVVSDIRDDINKSISICSFNEFGINYVDKALITSEDSISVVATLPKPSEEYNNKIVIWNNIYYMCLKCNNTYFWGEIDSEKALASISTKPLIDNFDLVLYPFKTIYKLNTKAEHDNSFKYDKTVYNKIIEDLSDNKTISHKFNLPEEDTNFKQSPLNNSSEIVAIKNYLKLNARMTTTTKVNPAEQSAIKNAIKTAIYEKFNLRQLDFGEEIPFDEILDTIQNADVRIKNIALDEPVLYTRFLLANNSEYDVAVKYTDSDANKKLAYENDMKAMMSPAELTAYNEIESDEDPDPDISKITASKAEKQEEYRKDRSLLAKKIYNKLALRNILAGRLNLFNYETEFIPSVTESKSSYDLIYPANNEKIKYITSELKINNVPKEDSAVDIRLKENQIVQFSAPNFKTIVTYPAYVNYFLKLNNTESKKAIPATFKRIRDFLIVKNEDKPKDYTKFEDFMNTSVKDNAQEIDAKKAESVIVDYGCVFIQNEDEEHKKSYSAYTDTPIARTTYYYYPLSKETYGVWFRFISEQTVNGIRLKGIYKNLGSDQSRLIGKMVDKDKNKFQLDYVGLTVVNPMDYYFVQETYTDDTDEHTKDGFGEDAVYAGLTANCEYELKKGNGEDTEDEYLCINYTNAESEADTSALESGGSTTLKTISDVINIYYGPGTIIKPNVQLIDSETRRESGSSWSKTSGFDFAADLGNNWKNLVEGMYSLGVNEQIEIRDVVKVQIYDNTDYSKVYVYFKLNNEKSFGEVEFLPAGTEDDPQPEYTLQEGEYFWYTDKNKTTLTYCGNGCKIINKTGYAIKKDADAGEVSVEKINEYGIEIIPWITLTNLKYDSEKKTGNYIEWIEYQYITLIAGDTLKWINLKGENITPNIGHAPIECGGAGYIFDGNEETLPKISVSNVGWSVRTKLGINTSPSTPQLLHNQKYVDSADEKIVDPNCEEIIRLFNDKPENVNEYYADTSTKLIEVIKSTGDELISIKTNYTVDETADLIQTAYNLINSSGDEITSVDDFKVKVFIDNEIRIKENQTNSEKLKLNNMNTYYTSLSFTDRDPGAQYSTIHCALNNPNNQFGIIMMYYISNSTNEEELVRLRIESSEDCSLSIFNNKNNENKDSWWDGLSGTITTEDKTYNTYYLKPNTTNSVNGRNVLNVIKIKGNIDNIFIDAGTDEGDILIFSPLRIVNVTDEDEGINLDLLKYYNITPSNSTNDEEDSRSIRALQLLKDIKEKDPNYEFFYNSIVDPSTELDINVYADPQESLSSPRIWYDYNNINNKFVVSEIDTDYLDTGITFASSSTKNY